MERIFGCLVYNENQELKIISWWHIFTI
jgi:hypothetical protein